MQSDIYKSSSSEACKKVQKEFRSLRPHLDDDVNISLQVKTRLNTLKIKSVKSFSRVVHETDSSCNDVKVEKLTVSF